MTIQIVGEDRRATYGFFEVTELRLQTEEGASEHRTVVRHPGAVVVVAVSGRALVVAQRQFRAALGRDVLELPAGKRDVAGEAVLDTARRELEEECGLVASSVEVLGSFYNSPGFTDEQTWVVGATGLSRGQRSPQSVEERAMELVALRLEELEALVASGVLEDAKSIVALLLARARGLARRVPNEVSDDIGELEIVGPSE